MAATAMAPAYGRKYSEINPGTATAGRMLRDSIRNKRKAANRAMGVSEGSVANNHSSPMIPTVWYSLVLVLSSMSAINGDKSRFHRQRRQKIARRMRDRKMFKGLTKGRQPAAPISKPGK